MLIHGQSHGGIAQGIGQALWEECVYDRETGQLLSGSLLDYAMPRADRLPLFTTEISEVPSTTNPLGMRGGSEGGITPGLAAVANAIVDALAEFGVEHIELPATPERVWRAIRTARATPRPRVRRGILEKSPGTRRSLAPALPGLRACGVFSDIRGGPVVRRHLRGHPRVSRAARADAVADGVLADRVGEHGELRARDRETGHGRRRPDRQLRAWSRHRHSRGRGRAPRRLRGQLLVHRGVSRTAHGDSIRLLGTQHWRVRDRHAQGLRDRSRAAAEIVGYAGSDSPSICSIPPSRGSSSGRCRAPPSRPRTRPRAGGGRARRRGSVANTAGISASTAASTRPDAAAVAGCAGAGGARWPRGRGSPGQPASIR